VRRAWLLFSLVVETPVLRKEYATDARRTGWTGGSHIGEG
jgi:hypothetical protein